MLLLSEPDSLVALGALLEGALYLGSIKMSRVVFAPTAYSKLPSGDQKDWDFRIASNVHAVAVTAAALALFLFSDLFSEQGRSDPVIMRSSWATDMALGFSLGFFMTDLTFMYSNPCLGGLEMAVHHFLSLGGLIVTAFGHKAHNYTLLAMASECTTPFLNTRWMLDKVGMRDSLVYFMNGVAILVIWLLGRIVLFTVSYAHLLRHSKEVWKLPWVTFVFVVAAPIPLFLLNAFWFAKIVRGALKLMLGTPEEKARHAEDDSAAIFKRKATAMQKEE